MGKSQCTEVNFPLPKEQAAKSVGSDMGQPKWQGEKVWKRRLVGTSPITSVVASTCPPKL